MVKNDYMYTSCLCLKSVIQDDVSDSFSCFYFIYFFMSERDANTGNKMSN